MVSALTSSIDKRIAVLKVSEPPQTMNVPAGGLSAHVVICGAGRVGRTVADALAQLRFPSVLIEIDDARVQQARRAGLAVVYGDATQRVVLEAAAVTRARAILVTIPVLIDVRGIVALLRRLHADAPIIARAEGAEAVRALLASGVTDVASPQYEAAIEMTRQALARLDVSAHDIQQVAGVIRRDRYGAARGGDLSPG